MRIDLARALSMYSLMVGLNAGVYNGYERIKSNYAADEKDSNYKEDYEKPDVIIDIKYEFTMFEGINRSRYAKIYKRVEEGKY